MKLAAWTAMLRKHDYGVLQPEAARVIIQGLTTGVEIEFVGDRTVSRTCVNLSSATDDPGVTAMVDAVIDADVALGRKAGPFRRRPFKVFCASPIGAVPKGGSWAEIRVIHHLSYPHGGDSINEHTLNEYVRLGTVDMACDLIVRCGRGCFLIKIDVKTAYKLVPVRPEDWFLLGFVWRGKYYYERTLPFGLRSSCRLWELYATALQHFFERELGRQCVVHYIDDFLFVIEQEAEARRCLSTALAVCDTLGVPISASKTEGPTTALTFLGIRLDTRAMRMSLDDGKLAKLRSLLCDWEGKSSATVTELQSLCGVLNFACKVVRPGRSYLRRIIDHATELGHATAPQPIPTGVRLDIRWWVDHAAEWNGHSMLYEAEWRQSPLIELYTDACETGYGAKFGNRWMHGRWSTRQLQAARNGNTDKLSMPYLELLALTLAVSTWAHHFTTWQLQLRVTFRSDCMPVVFAVNKRSSRTGRQMALLRTLHTIAARHSFDFTCVHVAGVANVSADALSRGDLATFMRDTPHHLPQADPVRPLPPPLTL